MLCKPHSDTAICEIFVNFLNVNGFMAHHMYINEIDIVNKKLTFYKNKEIIYIDIKYYACIIERISDSNTTHEKI